MLYALISPAILVGQLNSSTITVTASRDSSQQPDQATFYIAVDSQITQGLSEVVRAVTPVGVTSANLSSVYVRTGSFASQRILVWNFRLATPIARIKETTAALASLKQTLTSTNSGLSLSFFLSNSSNQQVSGCDVGALVADARAQAHEIARAAALVEGSIVGIKGDLTDGIPGCTINAIFTTLPRPAPSSGTNLITVNASRGTSTQVDQVNFRLTVESRTNVGLDDVISALTRAGVSGATFIGVSTNSRFVINALPEATMWDFRVSGPLSKLNEMLAQLLAAEQRLSGGFSLDVDVESLTASQQARPACRYIDLLMDAKTHALKLAAAAGVTFGPIVSMSRERAPTTPVVAAIFLFGYFGFPTFSTPDMSCALSVQFQLL